VNNIEVKKIMMMIGNEYPEFLPKIEEDENGKENDEKLRLKFETWYTSLKEFDFNFVQSKTLKLLHSHTYGTPHLSHLMTLLNPELEHQNIGQEFAERFVYLMYRLGADNMESAIYQEYGEIGREIYLNNKFDARNLKEADIPTFKAQIRNSFNSKYERKQKGLEIPENKNKFLIESKLKAIEVVPE
jgi:hypothetical protein